MYKEISLSNCLVRISLYDKSNQQIDLKNYELDEKQIRDIQHLAEQIFSSVGSTFGKLSLNTSCRNSYTFDDRPSQSREIYHLGLSIIREFSYNRFAHAHFFDEEDDEQITSSQSLNQGLRLDFSNMYLITPRSDLSEK